MKNSPLNKRVGAMLVATGILSRVTALQMFAEQQFEISPEQYLVLAIIMDTGELYQRQISEITYKDRPNVSRILNILEKLKLVHRVEDVNKRKIYKIKITEKGIEVRKKIQPYMQQLRDITTRNISEDDLTTCLEVLSQMQDNLKEIAKLQI